jgi:hypothetical protein
VFVQIVACDNVRSHLRLTIGLSCFAVRL